MYQNNQTIVYLPACFSRAIGTSSLHDDHRPTFVVVTKVLETMGFNVIIPEDLPSYCCGLTFKNQSFKKQAYDSYADYYMFMLRVTENGKYPVLMDYSRCSAFVIEKLGQDNLIKLYDSANFLHDLVLPRLPKNIIRKDQTIALHITCSNRTLGHADMLNTVAGRMAREVIAPIGTECCGASGNRWVVTPEVAKKAVRHVHKQIEECSIGYSTALSCQNSLTRETGILYYSIWNLVEEVVEFNYDTILKHMKRFDREQVRLGNQHEEDILEHEKVERQRMEEQRLAKKQQYKEERIKQQEQIKKELERNKNTAEQQD